LHALMTKKSTRFLKKISLPNKIIILLILALVVITIMVSFSKWLGSNSDKNPENKSPGPYAQSAKYVPTLTNISVDYRKLTALPGQGLTPKDLLLIDSSAIITVQIENMGFDEDSDQNGLPNAWFYNGKTEYTDQGCLSGKCFHINVDDSDTGWFLLNSDPADAIPGTIYNFTLKINCVNCKGNPGFMAIFWMGNVSSPPSATKKNNSALKNFANLNQTDLKTKLANTAKGNPNLTAAPDMTKTEADANASKIQEIRRNITPFNSTDGYSEFSVIAQAPERSIQAIFGVRIHTEGGKIQPKTELYIDR
jgi:hypothetical protein